MTPVETSLPEERGISTHLIADLAVSKVGTPAPEARHPETEFVRCFRHEGVSCARCDGLGFRSRKHCAGCGVPAGYPSRGRKALQPERGAKSCKELRSLPLYCMDCNPRFLKARLTLLEGMGG